MKKKIKIALLILSLAAVALLAVACGEPEEISVSENAMPQLTYVLGQELKLSDGVLLVDKGKKVVTLPMDSEEITVSGYDKNKLGEQTLTIEYDGATTEITVTVVERLTVSGAVTDYLVGDSIDKTKGRIIITNDDGTTRSIQMSGDAVSLVGFNSSGPVSGLDIKLVCKIGNESYEGSYKVNIHPVDSVEFKKPNKISYSSHYSKGIDLSGASLVISGMGGALKREVMISDDMVSGFDISAVTPQNSPLTQTVTVTYYDSEFTYDIKLTYTDVSMFIDNADKFSDIDWTGGEPDIDEELGELSLTLMNAYVDMSSADRALISDSAAYNVARAAMVYGFELWAENIKQFKGAFAIEYGELVLYCESYETSEKAIELFADKESPIYTLSPLLLDIIEIYGDTVVYETADGNVYFSSYPVMDESYIDFLSSTFRHLVDVYETLSAVPDDWTADSLDSYSFEIQSVYLKIVQEGYDKVFDGLYYFVSDWRTNDDLFEILYTYLYKIDRTDFVEYLYSFGLPKVIDELYGYIYYAMIGMESIRNLDVADTTAFFYYYLSSVRSSDDIKLNADGVENYIYRTMPINSLFGFPPSDKLYFEDILAYIRTASYGYYHLSGALLGIPEYESLMSKYIALVDNIYNKEGYSATESFIREVKAVFDAFVALPASMQYDFISALNALYSQGIPELAFDDSQENIDKGFIGTFALVINEAMRGTLSEASRTVYNDLILAIEIYANRFGYPEWESDFCARIDRISAALTEMDEDDMASFNTYLASAYKKYLDIREGLEATGSVDLGDWAVKFDALGSALADAQTACYYLTTAGKINYTYFLSSFERATAISENIIKNAPAEVIAAYYGEPLFLAYPEDAAAQKPAVYWSYDYAMSSYRVIYVNILVFFGDTGTCVYDAYNERKMGAFLDSYYSMLSAFVHRTEAQTPVFDRAAVLSVLDAYRLLDTESKSFFNLMEADIDIYHAALELFINEAFTAAAAEVAVKLYTLEQYCYSYDVVQSDVTLNSIKSLLSELKVLYAALGTEDKESFADLEQTYAYYVNKCENIA